MIRCLCTGAMPLARLLSPSMPIDGWPPGVEAFLAGEITVDDGHSGPPGNEQANGFGTGTRREKTARA